MKLSILIATIPQRQPLFVKLMADIERQASGHPVEVLYDAAPKGAMSIGAKRQALLERASGDYITYVDDDDGVADTYVSDILKAIEGGPDCVGFQIEVHGMGGVRMASASNRYERWEENVDGFDYVRTTYHKTPVRRDHALAIGFKDMRFAEDHDYSMRLKASGLLHGEAYIRKVLYIYRYRYESINIKFGIK